MDWDVVPYDVGDPAPPALLSSGTAGQPPPWYCIEAFARDLAHALAPHNTTVRLNELGNGTRLIVAWRSDSPAKQHVISADYIRVCSDEVRFVARAIMRSLESGSSD